MAIRRVVLGYLLVMGIVLSMTGVQAADADIVVTEVMAVTGSSADEYIEILNTGGTAVDVSGWSFTDGDGTDVIVAWVEATHGNITDADPTFNTTSIPAGAYGVILDPDYDGGSQIYDLPEGAIILTISSGTALGGSALAGSDPITLYDANGTTNDDVISSYGSPVVDDNPLNREDAGGDTIPVSPSSGFSAERIVAGDADSETNWRVSIDTGTPGKINSVSSTGIVINEVMAVTSSSADEYIELYNSGTSDIDVSGWNFTDGDGTDEIVAWVEGTHGDIADADPTFGTTIIPSCGYALIMDPDYDGGTEPYDLPAGVVILTIASGTSLGGSALASSDPITLYNEDGTDSSNVVSTYGTPKNEDNPLDRDDDGADTIPGNPMMKVF